MKRLWKTTLPVLVVAVLAQQCSEMETADAADQTATATSSSQEVLARVVNVEAVTIEPANFVDYIRITGEAEALHDVLISAEEGGVLGAFQADKGARVRAGQLLVTIGAEVLRAQVDEARASAALADEQFARQQRLWEQEGIGSEIAFLTARYSAEMARARLATLEARLDKATIRAPVAGFFDEQYVDPGEIVTPGARIARVVSIGQIKVGGGVPERYAPFVRPGRAAVITFDIMPGRAFNGAIAYVGSSVNNESRTFPIEIVMDNPDRVIKPQMVANVQLVREELNDVVLIPQSYVVRSENGYHVNLIDESGSMPIARQRPVALGPSYAGQVVITEGLSFGDRIVGVGAQLVDDGSRLAIVGAEGASP